MSENSDIPNTVLVLVWFEALRPIQQFFMSERSHRFLGITSTFREVNVSCSRIHHTALSKDRTPTSRSGVRRSTTRLRRRPTKEVKEWHVIF